MPRRNPLTVQTFFSRTQPSAVRAQRLPRPVPCALACAVALAWWGVPLQARAQSEPAPSLWDAPPPALRSSPLLKETIPEAVRPQLPVFVQGDRIEGQTDLKATIEGNAELRRGDTVIRADRLDYNVPEDLAKAQGHVRINRAGNVYEGTALELRVDAFEGFFTDARYRFLATQAHGDATRVDFIDRDRAVVHSATYTTCERGNEASWQPDWVLRAKTIRIDNEEQVGTAENAVLEFKGVPLLPVPYITFPLSDKRKSGLLPPTIGLDSRDGVAYMQPYYWNIAPNRDATFTAQESLRRGPSLQTEYRYLEPSFFGSVDFKILPHDSVADRSRYALHADHEGDDRGVQQRPVVARHVDLAGLPAQFMDARIERPVAAARRIDRQRADDERRLEHRLEREQRMQRKRRRHLSAVDQRDLDVGTLERLGGDRGGHRVRGS